MSELIAMVFLAVELLSRDVVTYMFVSQTGDEILSFLAQVSIMFSKSDSVFVGKEEYFFLTT